MSKCKKKSTTMSTAQRKLAEIRTRNNKLHKLEKQVRNNPDDLSARNALAQVRYDIKMGV